MNEKYPMSVNDLVPNKSYVFYHTLFGTIFIMFTLRTMAYEDVIGICDGSYEHQLLLNYYNIYCINQAMNDNTFVFLGEL